MRAKDVMTPNVITVDENTSVEQVAQTLLRWRISAVPVLDTKERLIGIVGEGDLLRRAESGTDRLPPWWLTAIADPEARATDYTKTHGQLARDVMTKDVVTVDENASVAEIAQLLEERRIKRVPVLRNSKVVGIVSRANLLHGLAAADLSSAAPGDNDQEIRAAVLNHLRNDAEIAMESLNVTVGGGVAHVWGTALSDAQKDVIRIIVESTPGVKQTEDHMTILPEIFRQWLPQEPRW